VKNEENTEMLLGAVEGKKDENFDAIRLVRAATRIETQSPIKQHTYKFKDPNLLKVINVIKEEKQRKITAAEQIPQDETMLKQYLGKLIATALMQRKANNIPSAF
jgi:hypothetical protein